MVFAPHSQQTRLVQVRALTGAYPYYGTVETDPPDRWPALQTGRNALVDPAVLIHLDAHVGDTLTVGEARFVIAGMYNHCLCVKHFDVSSSNMEIRNICT